MSPAFKGRIWGCTQLSWLRAFPINCLPWDVLNGLCCISCIRCSCPPFPAMSGDCSVLAWHPTNCCWMESFHGEINLNRRAICLGKVQLSTVLKQSGSPGNLRSICVLFQSLETKKNLSRYGPQSNLEGRTRWESHLLLFWRIQVPFQAPIVNYCFQEILCGYQHTCSMHSHTQTHMHKRVCVGWRMWLMAQLVEFLFDKHEVLGSMLSKA